MNPSLSLSNVVNASFNIELLVWSLSVFSIHVINSCSRMHCPGGWEYKRIKITAAHQVSITKRLAWWAVDPTSPRFAELTSLDLPGGQPSICPADSPRSARRTALDLPGGQPSICQVDIPWFARRIALDLPVGQPSTNWEFCTFSNITNSYSVPIYFRAHDAGGAWHSLGEELNRPMFN